MASHKKLYIIRMPLLAVKEGEKGHKIKKGLRRVPIFVNLKSNTMKNTVQR